MKRLNRTLPSSTPHCSTLVRASGRAICLAVLLGAATAATAVDLPILPAIQTGTFTLDVECGGIATRSIHIDEYSPEVASIGTIIFTSGEDGHEVYNAPAFPNRADTVDTVVAAGYQVYVVSWPEGWGENAEGAGYGNAVCGYADAVNFILTLAENGETLCAQGNSGGAQQIAYGIDWYGLDGVFDYVLYTSGPMLSRVAPICLTGLGATEFGIDFTNKLEFSGEPLCNPDLSPENLLLLQADSLVSPEYEDRAYETRTHFYTSENDTSAANVYGKFLFDVTTSWARWRNEPGNVHHLDKTVTGAMTVTSLLLDNCKEEALELEITGDCTDEVTMTVTGGTPGANVSLSWSRTLDREQVPVGGCAGTELDLDEANYLTALTTDENGEANFVATPPASACGTAYLQAMDVTTCEVSNVALLR